MRARTSHRPYRLFMIYYLLFMIYNLGAKVRRLTDKLLLLRDESEKCAAMVCACLQLSEE